MRKSFSNWDTYLRRFGFNRSKQSGRKTVRSSRALRCEPLESRELLSATYYVDATDGNDSWDGLAGTYASGTNGPWKTIAKVNASKATTAAGDSILFQRGETWREYLSPDSGSSVGGAITYGAYGTGDKPQILGSVELNDTSNWTYTGSNNVWSTTPAVDLVTTSGSEMLSNPSFATSSSGWTTFRQSPASTLTWGRYTSTYDTSPACCRVKAGADNGDSWDDIALRTTSSMSITTDQYYLLTFRAKASTAFSLHSIDLHKSGTPGTSYAGENRSTASNFSITTSWATYKMLFKANGTQSDAVLSFYMGNLLPNNATFYIDTLSFKACAPSGSDRLLDTDVGNIIFGNGVNGLACGTKRWYLTDQASPPDIYTSGLDNVKDFYYDASNWTVKVRTSGSTSSYNPATAYTDLELALTGRLIYEESCSYVTYENLDLRYSGSHGISGSGTEHITISDCDISYMGGGLFGYESGLPVRFGNGIEFYGNAHDNTVERCKISNIFDSGVTNQGMQTGYTQYNINYFNNVIWNCEISYEYSMAGSCSVHDVKFENNTCVNAGYGWGHDQRPDSWGTHFQVGSGASVYNFSVYGNIFSQSTDYAIAFTTGTNGTEGYWVDYNLYHSTAGNLADWLGTDYTFGQWSSWETAVDDNSGSDLQAESEDHSFASSSSGYPAFVDASNYDYHLTSSSPAKNAGCGGLSEDHDGSYRPYGGGYDMGAYEAPVLDADFSASPTTLGFTAGGNVGPATMLDTGNGIWDVDLAAAETSNYQYSSLPANFTNDIVSGEARISFSGGSSNLDDRTIVFMASDAGDYAFSVAFIPGYITGYRTGASTYSISVNNNDAAYHTYGWMLDRVNQTLSLTFDGSSVGSSQDVSGNWADSESLYFGDATGGSAHAEIWDRWVMQEGEEDYGLMGMMAGGEEILAMSVAAPIDIGTASTPLADSSIARRQVFQLLGVTTGKEVGGITGSDLMLEDASGSGLVNTLARTLVSRRSGRRRT